MVLNWDKVSFVLRGKYRGKVLLNLTNPKTPTQLGKDLEVHRAHISRALLQLVDKGIVECLTPNERMGRLYKRTKEGDEIAEYLEKVKKQS
jgi:predicted transcriptional regulator